MAYTVYEQLDKNDIRYLDTFIKVISKLSQVASYNLREAFMCTVQNNKCVQYKIIKKIIMVDLKLKLLWWVGGA